MKLAEMLNQHSKTALNRAKTAATDRKAQKDHTYLMEMLRSRNPKNVIWARKRLGLDKVPPAIAKPVGQKIQSTHAYKVLRVE